eukprot:TRINITY_DN29553_c0_g1_i1.p1 TRINITY_DN29553_c0_g1~~TRINITY_DN29553_c0_g1_i1.p1  ORF type:complete len:280 (-),score=18.02 TRINITY_DN29553_c0_g1_i1:838-1677(-)
MPKHSKSRNRLTQLCARTRMCRFFAENACELGVHCNFAHEMADLRPKPQLEKTKLCGRWMQNGACSLGEACPFAHGQAELSGPVLRPQEGHPAPVAAEAFAPQPLRCIMTSNHHFGAGEAATLQRSEEMEFFAHEEAPGVTRSRIDVFDQPEPVYDFQGSGVSSTITSIELKEVGISPPMSWRRDPTCPQEAVAKGGRQLQPYSSDRPYHAIGFTAIERCSRLDGGSHFELDFHLQSGDDVLVQSQAQGCLEPSRWPSTSSSTGGADRVLRPNGYVVTI